MKYLIPIFFCFLGIGLNAQRVASDTTYLTVRGDTIFKISDIRYVNGQRILQEEPIARDTANAAVVIRQQATAISNQYADYLHFVEDEATFRKTIKAYSDAFLIRFKRTYFEDIEKQMSIELLGNYTFKVGSAAALKASFVKNAQGVLKLKIDGTNYGVDLYSDRLLRLRNFQGVDVFIVRQDQNSRIWTGGIGKYILKKTQ